MMLMLFTRYTKYDTIGHGGRRAQQSGEDSYYYYRG